MSTRRVHARATSPRARLSRLRSALSFPITTCNLLAALLLLLLGSPFPSALACGSPPPTDCTLTVSIIVIVPSVILSGPNPVVVPVRTVVFIGGSSNPSGMPCATRLGTDVNLFIGCSPGPNPAPPAPVVLPAVSGVYIRDIPVTFPAGPPRTCTLTGTAVSHYSSPPGTTITGTSTTQVCIVNPAPGNPSKPRLDLTLVSPSSRLAHPGDERTHVYRVTNNDPIRSFSGTLTGTSTQAGYMSTMSPAPAPGSGSLPTSAASPFSGDNFPIAFSESERPPVIGANNYSTDDGVAEDAIGLTPTGSLIWLNDFNVVLGQTIIDRVSVSFGAGTAFGERVVLGLWSDPNNDGNPADAILLASAEVGAFAGGTGLFNDYPFPPTTVGPVGAHFFVGAMIQSTANPPELPAAIDRTTDLGKSWVTFADPCEGNMGALSSNAIIPMHPAAFGFAGNFMIRAHGSPMPDFQNCVPLGDPGLPLTPIARTLTLCPGESRLISINQRSYRMCRTGACSHLLTSISGVFSDATPGLGCAGAGLMVDSSIPPDFRCPDGGFMAACSASGPPGSLHFTGTMPTHAIDEQVRLVNVQINPQGFPQPTLSQPQFGLLDSDLSVHNAGRIAEAGTFPVPIPNGTTIQVGAVIEVLPLVPGQTGPLLPPIEVHPGDPMLGDSYFFINPHSRLSGPGIPPALNSFFDVFQTVSLDGLDTSLRHHRFTITTSSIIVTPISATQYSVNFSGSFPINPGTPLPVTRVNLNFDSVGNAYGAPPTVHCPVVEALAQSVAADYNTGPITLSVAAHGEEPMTFQWSKNAVILAESPSPHSVAGTRSSSLIINPTRSTDAGLYTCLVTNTCGSATSPPITLTIRCHADFNGVGGLTVADIFDFLAAWFSGDPRADFNGDGVISVTDIFDFLAAWFAGCTP